MTLAEIEELDADFLTVKQVSECMHVAPQLIRDQCERDVKWLGFPIARIGHSFRIPRRWFITWARGETPVMSYPTGFNEMIGGDAN